MNRSTLMFAGLAVAILAVLITAAITGGWFHSITVEPPPSGCGEASSSGDPDALGAGKSDNENPSDETQHDDTGTRDSNDEDESPEPVESPDWREVIDSTMRARLTDVLVHAQGVLDARKQGLDEEKQLVKEKWHEEQRALRAWIGDDLERAIAMLEYFGAMDDNPDLALYAARMFPNVFPDGFEEHLIAVTRSSAEPELERMVAMVGLRARGHQAAKAVEVVARDTDSTRLKAHATEELAGHIGDPRTIQSRNRILQTTEENLRDSDPSVRLAALHVYMAERREKPDSLKSAVARMATDDPDDRVRSLATRLASR